MAFTEIARWEATAGQPLLQLRSWHREDCMPVFPAWLKKPAGLASACALHLGVAFALLQFSQGNDHFAPLDSVPSGLKLFSLPTDGEEEKPPAPQKTESAGGSTLQAAAAPTHADPAPAEWTMSRIRVARSAAPAAVQTAAAPGLAAPAAASGAAGGGGSGGFDPYAGASPQRPGEMRAGLQAGMAGLPSPFGGTAAGADSRIMALHAFLVRELAGRYPRLKGSFLLTVRLDSENRFSDLILKHGPLDRSALQWLRGRLRDAPGATGSATGSLVDLPEIRLL